MKRNGNNGFRDYFPQTDQLDMKKQLLTFVAVLFSFLLYAQQKGNVTDARGNPLPGVNIVEKGTQNGTVTDTRGAFTLALTSPDPVLVFSFIGYLKTEAKADVQNTLSVVLNEDHVGLDEVVVVGYGTAKKSDLTGSVSSVKPKDLNLGAISNAAQMLQGRIPGLYVSSHNQDPGATPEFILRGASSFQQGEAGQPLIVIDGFPMDNTSFINSINPNDIQQIDVLKDASATAIYGSRGANGVIIITTKQGNTKGIQVDYDAKFFSQSVAREVDMMDAQQYARFYFDLAHDPDLKLGTYGPANGFPHPFSSWDSLKNTDWQKEVINTGNLTQEHNLSISGVREGVKYRASANYYDGDGMISPSGYKRINTLAKLSYDYKKFSFDLDFNYTNENRNLLENSFIYALEFSPSSPVYDAAGELSTHAFAPNASWVYNPLFPEVAEEHFSENNATRISGGIEYEILDGLRVSVKGGITQSTLEDFFQRFKPLYTSQKETEGSISSYSTSQTYADYFLKYNKKTGDHNFSMMAGGSYQGYINKGLYASAVDMPYINIGYYNIGAGLVDRNMGSSWYEKRVLSGLARFNYDYKDKYLLTFNYRLDGATVFGENNKWGQFPSLGLAYRIDQEDFFRDNVSFLSTVKLRAGYGIAGNANIPGFRTQNLIDFTPAYEGGGISNAIIWGSTYLPNPDLHWEKTKTLNLGLEFGNPLFYAEVDYYIKNSNDLILDRQIPTELGFSSITINKGAMVNRGIETKLDLFLKFFNNKFQWKPSAWFSYNLNEITDLNGDMILDKSIWINRTSYGYAGIKQKGYPLNSIWGYDFIGVWQKDDAEKAAIYNSVPGDPRFADLKTVDENGNVTDGPDGKITEEDRVFLGDANPKFTAGLNNQFNYGNFELSFFFEGVFDKKIVNANKAMLTFPGYNYGNNKMALALDRWSPSNPSNDVPSLTKNLTQQLIRSDWTIEDGSFVRLRDVTLAYKLYFKDAKFLKNLRAWVSVTNLVTFTNYTGINPDVWATDEAYNLKPFTRTYTLGISTSF
jgi:TonB-dependent starch-binding outer membrane protein SusC